MRALKLRELAESWGDRGQLRIGKCLFIFLKISLRRMISNWFQNLGFVVSVQFNMYIVGQIELLVNLSEISL